MDGVLPLGRERRRRLHAGHGPARHQHAVSSRTGRRSSSSWSSTPRTGATPNTVDVTHLTAISRANPDLFDAATDTTTVVSATSHDLSGGGTRLADPGDLVNHPGTIVNLSPTAVDRFELYLTESSLFGLDPLLHPTALHVDKDGDGVIEPPRRGGDPPTREHAVAVDLDGDGDWDTIDPDYNLGPDPLAPDVAVAEGSDARLRAAPPGGRRPGDRARASSRSPRSPGPRARATA